MSRKYTNEFKESIIKMMREGANAQNLSDEYGPNYRTILRWYREA